MKRSQIVSRCNNLMAITDKSEIEFDSKIAKNIISNYFSFLGSIDQKTYFDNILYYSIECATSSLTNKKPARIEISFPENRKNDISVTESLDVNTYFSLQFARQISRNRNLFQDPTDIWMVFPDKQEGIMALKNEDRASIPFTVTSIDILYRQLQSQPKLVESLGSKTFIFVNPGFNVEEWIILSKISDLTKSSSIIIINGNLDRLRKGYYPSFFYPGLAAVTKSFYLQFEQTFFLSPIAVNGDRLGAWLCRSSLAAPANMNAWALLVRRNTAEATDKLKYLATELYDKEPDPKSAWNTAKDK